MTSLSLLLCNRALVSPQQTGFENAWLLFDTFLSAVAQRCADVTEAKWTGRLAGADVFTFDNCLKMTLSIAEFD